MDDDALAAGISAILNEPLSAAALLKLDFTVRTLSEAQRHTIGVMLDFVGTSYLEHAPFYKGD